MAGSKAGDARDLLQTERLRIVLVDVIDRAPQAAILSRGDGTPDRACDILGCPPISRQQIVERACFPRASVERLAQSTEALGSERAGAHQRLGNAFEASF